MIVLALVQKIASLLLLLAGGFTLVKSGLLRSEDSKSLSVMALYLFGPCAILNSTQIELTNEVIEGLLLATIAALAIQLILIVGAAVLGKVLGLSTVERMSVIYSNCGNLIFPLVTATLGSEWVVYMLPYATIQTFFMWSHAKSAILGIKGIDLKKIFLSVNMIAIFASLIFLFAGVRFGGFLSDAMRTLGDFIGPASMIVAGMLIGSMAPKDVFANKRVWLVVFLRLVVASLVVTAALKLSLPVAAVANAPYVLMITLFASVAPSASTIMQMAQVFDNEPQHASAINAVSTICCLLTMPAMVALYQL